MQKEIIKIEKNAAYRVRTILERILHVEERLVVKSSADVVDFLRPHFGDEIETREYFFALYLSRSNRIIGFETISAGGTCGTVVDIKMLMRTTLNVGASAIILSHNHPSGNTTPSPQDLDLTKKINQACKFHEIKLLDHVIITYSSYFSFADEGSL